MFKPSSISLLLLFCSVSPAALAEDDLARLLKELRSEVSALKAQLNRSNARIGELERKLARRNARVDHDEATDGIESKSDAVVVEASAETDGAYRKPPVTSGDVRGTYKIPGTDTSIGIGGFVKADFIFNSISAGRDRLGNQQVLLSQVPIEAAGVDYDRLVFHAKESRLWFKSYTPSAWGDINTFVEMDFFGDPAVYTYTPRLRHAYGSIGPLLAGQTWTTFLNVATIPDHLDFGTSAGSLYLFRQPLLRWSQPFSVADTELEWQVALEAPRSRIWDAESSSANSNDPNAYPLFIDSSANRYPDFVARLNVSPEWGSLSMAALGRQIRYDNGTGGHDEWGGAVSLAGRINVFTLDNLRFIAHYGNGHGRYVTSVNTFSDASIDGEGNLVLTTGYGGMLSYQHWWDEKWRSTLTYGISRAEQPGFVNRLLTRQVQSLHANLLWSPVSQVVLGVEYIYATRELLDGRDGDLQRVQISARYNF